MVLVVREFVGTHGLLIRDLLNTYTRVVWPLLHNPDN